MFCQYVVLCYNFVTGSAMCGLLFLPCFLPKVISEHQTTEIVEYYYNELPVNCLTEAFALTKFFLVDESSH